MDEAIIARLRGLAADRGWRGVVVVSPENVCWAAGFPVPSQSLMRWRHAACIVPVEGQPGMLVVDMELATVRHHLPDLPVAAYGEFTDDPMAALAGTLIDRGWSDGTIGIELGYLPAADASRLAAAAPGLAFEACDAALAEARQRKTPAEIERLRTLSRLTDASIGEALGSVEAGMTEMDVAARVTAGLFARGADTFKLLIVASGERSGFPNVGPTSRALAPGDLIRLEVFGVVGGYHAGVCRTGVVGTATPEQERVWSVIARCREQVLGGIRPGASGAEIYRDFAAVFAREGLPAIDFVGHGIGVFLHEEPYLGRFGDATLDAGMVLGIEPLVYAPGQGMQCKDMVLVTSSGAELLSDVTPTDRLFPIRA
ncbi:MAG TPA: Xaa-Pro peptidase family protein [Candidatus Limnocylindrales bacterium]|jgi:Xaa-Pro aminopeptidase|nr:Xaa-Pro peptidase family protein [Candidatus Limnocylindrales bacterium]